MFYPGEAGARGSSAGRGKRRCPSLAVPPSWSSAALLGCARAGRVWTRRCGPQPSTAGGDGVLCRTRAGRRLARPGSTTTHGDRAGSARRTTEATGARAARRAGGGSSTDGSGDGSGHAPGDAVTVPSVGGARTWASLRVGDHPRRGQHHQRADPRHRPDGRSTACQAYLEYLNQTAGGVCGRQRQPHRRPTTASTPASTATRPPASWSRAFAIVGGWAVTDDGGASGLDGSERARRRHLDLQRPGRHANNFSSNPIPPGTSGGNLAVLRYFIETYDAQHRRRRVGRPDHRP